MALIELESTMKCKSVMDLEKMYRYSLIREWDITLPKIVYIMLNPSIADHLKGDPTLNKCLNFAIESGYGSIEIVNLFAFRATDPGKLKKVKNPIGINNDAFIINAVTDAETVILAWGAEKGKYLSRDEQVLELIYQFKDKIKCFEDYSDTKKPQHPLTLKNGFILIDFPFDRKNNDRTIDTNPQSEFGYRNFANGWEQLNHIELNKFARKMAISKFTNDGFIINSTERDLLLTSPSGNQIQLQVRSILSTTNYVLLPKSRFNADQEDLFLLLIVFTRNELPEQYLIPASAFKWPNELFKDRDHYDPPEYGMNVSSRNMYILNQYKIEEMLHKIF